jgi:protein-disulfide isomerase
VSPSEKKKTEADRRAEARARAERMRLDAERRARRQRTLVVAITAAVVVALVVGVGIVIQRSRSQAAEDARGPAGLTERGGLVLGDDDAPVTVTTYVDFMCPACEQFETENAALLDELRGKGTVRVEYVPIAILDRFSSGTRYSTRSAGAAYCVAESNPDLVPLFVSALYENQPAEGSTGLPQQQLVDIARLIGVSERGQECITDGTYEGYAANVTDQASQDGVQGTPTVLVDGTFLDDLSKQGLVDMINAKN